MSGHSNSDFSSALETFRLASSFVSTLPSKNFSVSDRLRLYGLFKIVTTSNISPLEKSASFWDFEAKAKLDSWKAVYKELLSLSNSSDSEVILLAVEEYVNRAKELGWEVPVSKKNEFGIQIDQNVREQLSRIMNEEGSKILKKGQISDFTSFTQKGKCEKLSVGEEEEGEGEEGEEESSDPEEKNKNNERISRDEYGFPLKNIQSDERSLNKSAPAQSEAGSSFGMASVSKMIETPMIERLDTNNSSNSLSKDYRLHELILDKDESGALRYLERVQKENGKAAVGVIINEFYQGYTPLHLASDQGLYSVVQELLKLGVDFTLKDQNDQLTALELAREAEMFRIEELLRKYN